MKYRIATIIVVIGSLFGAVDVSHAAWTTGGVALDGSGSGLKSTRMVPDGANGWYVAWEHGELSGNLSIWLQRIDSNGDPAPGWSTPLVFGPSTGTADFDIANDGIDGCLIAWSSQSQLYVRRILAAGIPAPTWSGGNGTSEPLRNEPVYPRIVRDGHGGAFVAWWDATPPSSSPFHFTLTHVDSAGNVAAGWPATPGAALRFGDDTHPFAAITPDGSGGVYSVWVDSGSEPGPHLIRVAGDASVVPGWPSGGFVLDASAADYYYGPQLVTSILGDVLVVWKRAPATPIDDVLAPGTLMAQRVSAAGAIAAGWPASGLSVFPSTDSITTPQAVSDGTGGAIIAWVQHGAADVTRLRATHITFDALVAAGWPAGGLDVSDDGAAIRPEISSEVDPALEQHFTMAVDGPGGALLAWTDDRGPTAPDVLVRRVANDGSFPPGWSSPVALRPVATESGSVRAIIYAGTGGAVVASTSEGSGSSGDLLLTRLAPDGSVATLASLAAASIEAGVAHLSWLVSDAAGVRFTIERRVDADAWAAVGEASPDGRGVVTIDDAVPAGATSLAYRLAWISNGVHATAGEVTLTVPGPARFALERVAPNPANGAITVRFALRAGLPATLELIDIAGRRMRSEAVEPGAGGERVIRLGELDALPAGMYLVRLAQGGERAMTRVLVVR